MAERLGAEDAPNLIEVAREVPLGGTADPEQLTIPKPWHYRDSPELPARRVASDWEDYPGYDPYVRRIIPSEIPRPTPNVLTRIKGHAREVYDADADEEAWRAYQDGLLKELKEAEVALVPTVYIAYGPYPDFEGEFTYIFSIYVVDLARYEPRSMPIERIQGEDFVPEEIVQKVCIPRDLSWWKKRRRKRAQLL